MQSTNLTRRDLLRVAAFCLFTIAMISCSTTVKTRTHTVPADFVGVGIWSGLLKCNRDTTYGIRMHLWETEPELLKGNINLVQNNRTDRSAENDPIAYPVSVRRHQYGSLIIEPDRANFPNIYKDKPFMVSLSGRLDPESKNIIGSIRRGCHARLVLRPETGKSVDSLAQKYGKHDAKTQKRIDNEKRELAAREACQEKAKNNSAPVARYHGSSDYLSAPAYKGGLFIYKHNCLSAGKRKAAIISSRTPPDDSGEFIEVFSGPFEPGTKVSRREITIMTLPQVCNIFDYDVVGGRKMMCEPYGWKYTELVKRQCINKSSNILLAPRALQCQLMVMGGVVTPFERGPKQQAAR